MQTRTIRIDGNLDRNISMAEMRDGDDPGFDQIGALRSFQFKLHVAEPDLNGRAQTSLKRVHGVTKLQFPPPSPTQTPARST